MRLYEAATAYIEFESMFDRNNVSIGRATAGPAPGDGRRAAYGHPGKPAFTGRKTRESIRAIVVLILIAAVCGIVRAQQSAASPASKPPVEQMVPMRDGVKLATAVYLPEGHGPWAVVLIRTPYGKDTQAMGVSKWNARGFVLAVQDVRGRLKSEGTYKPFFDDTRDGYDTVEWVAKQSWSNGRVGMYGVSAMGITANLAAVAAPPHLVANFVMLARSSAYHQAVFQGGIFRKELNENWLKRQGALDTLNETFKHNVYEGYYDSNELWKYWPTMRVPTYNYAGWYDIFEQGNIDNFVGLQQTGGGLALGNQKLIVGPWGHGKIEEVTYPPNATLNPVDEALRWFDYWLNGKDNGIMSEPPIRYYVMGDVADPKAPGNEWRTAIAWPPPSRPTSYFLNSGGTLSTRMPGDEESSDSYKYDPKNPVPT